MAHPSVNQKPTGLRKAATLMVLLGDKLAVNVFRMLPPRELKRLTREIAALGPISVEVGSSIAEEYKKAVVNRQILSKGDSDFAQKLLVEAFGETTGESLLKQAMTASDLEVDQGGALKNADPQLLAKLLEAETPQTLAMVVAHLGAKAAASLLACLPEKKRPQVVERVAKLRDISPEMVQRILAILQEKIAVLGRQERLTFLGINAVADLLNALDSATGKTILSTIEAADKDLANSISMMMFTFDDLLKVPQAGLRELLVQADKKSLAMAMKGASEELFTHIAGSMSSRAAEMLKEDIEALGSVRAREIQKARLEISELARKLEAEGKLVRAGSEDELAEAA